MKNIIFTVLFLSICLTVNAGWEQVTSPVSAHLKAVQYLDSDNIFVAGASGTILHYDSTWTEMENSSDKNLNCIHMFSETDGWAAGVEGTILRCEEGTWSTFPTEDQQRTYNDLLAFAEDDIYFIGYSLLDGGILEHWDGTELVEIHTFSDNMVDLEGTSGNDLWVAGGNNAIAHFDGTSWDTSMATFPDDVKIFSLEINDAGNPVVTAVKLPSWDVDMILEYIDGRGWLTLWEGFEKRIMTCEINETRGYALGNGGRIIENTIFGWEELPNLGTSQLNDLTMPNMSEAWAVGDSGTIYKYEEASINVVLSNQILNADTTFEVSYIIMNPGPPQENVMQILFLDVYGLMWFWPSWSPDFDFVNLTLTEDYFEETVLFSFNWPAGAGTGEAALWGALLDTQSNILGYDKESFNWN